MICKKRLWYELRCHLYPMYCSGKGKGLKVYVGVEV